MEYKTTESAPKRHGMYKAKIKASHGGVRECYAQYGEKGWTPIDDHLIHSEKIISYLPS